MLFAPPPPESVTTLSMETKESFIFPRQSPLLVQPKTPITAGARFAMLTPCCGRGGGASGRSLLHITSREENEARLRHTCSRPCAFEEKKRPPPQRNHAAPRTYHGIHSSPATVTTSRRRATEHVPRVGTYSPTSIDPGFVEIGLVHLAQSVQTTNDTHAQIDRRTNDIMTSCTHPGMRKRFCL